MENSFEQHRKKLIKEAIEHWDEKGELRDIEYDPVVKLLFSALAYQSHSISREISTAQKNMVTEFRNKLIPYHLIKPFPALSIIETKLNNNNDSNIEPLDSFIVDDKCEFEFGKAKMMFAPLFKTKILNARISDKEADKDSLTIQLKLSCESAIDDFSGMSFYFEDSGMVPDIEISLNDKMLPLINPDDYDNLPFTDSFCHHYLLREENQQQFGNYDYWQEFFIKNRAHIFYINEYDTEKIRNTSSSPVFKIHFKSRLELQYFQNRNIRINCLPVLNVQKRSVRLNDSSPVKKLSEEKSVFLSLLVNENSETDDDNFYIRHFGVERFNQEELLFQINDLFNRFVSDYYAFKDIDELKKGEKLENLYKAFREMWPVIMRNKNTNYSGAYAIIKLKNNLRYQSNDVVVNYLTTNCEMANGIKEGEKAGITSEFLDKDSTILLKETTGGREEEFKEDNLNHLARYSFLTKDRIVTISDIKAFCYRELKNKVQNVVASNTGKRIDIQIKLKGGSFDQQEKSYYESLIRQKIKVRSLFCLPINVTISN
jgi:hypothetical protein